MSLLSKLATLAATSVKSLNHGGLLAEIITEVAIHAAGVPISQDKHGELLEHDSGGLEALEKRVLKLEKLLKKQK